MESLLWSFYAGSVGLRCQGLIEIVVNFCKSYRAFAALFKNPLFSCCLFQTISLLLARLVSRVFLCLYDACDCVARLF